MAQFQRFQCMVGVPKGKHHSKREWWSRVNSSFYVSRKQSPGENDRKSIQWHTPGGPTTSTGRHLLTLYSAKNSELTVFSWSQHFSKSLLIQASWQLRLMAQSVSTNLTSSAMINPIARDGLRVLTGPLWIFILVVIQIIAKL